MAKSRKTKDCLPSGTKSTPKPSHGHKSKSMMMGGKNQKNPGRVKG